MGRATRLYDPRARKLALVAGAALVGPALVTIYLLKDALGGGVSHEGTFAILSVVTLLLGIGCGVRLRGVLRWARSWTAIMSVGVAVGYVLSLTGCERAKATYGDARPAVALGFAAWHAVAWVLVFLTLRAESGNWTPRPPSNPPSTPPSTPPAAG